MAGGTTMFSLCFATRRSPAVPADVRLTFGSTATLAATKQADSGRRRAAPSNACPPWRGTLPVYHNGNRAVSCLHTMTCVLQNTCGEASGLHTCRKDSGIRGDPTDPKMWLLPATKRALDAIMTVVCLTISDSARLAQFGALTAESSSLSLS